MAYTGTKIERKMLNFPHIWSLFFQLLIKLFNFNAKEFNLQQLFFVNLKKVLEHTKRIKKLLRKYNLSSSLACIFFTFIGCSNKTSKSFFFFRVCFILSINISSVALIESNKNHDKHVWSGIKLVYL